jgi:hypothetical protein
MGNSSGADCTGKNLLKLLPAGYAVAIPLALASPWSAFAIYVAIAILWLIPDRRIKKVLEERP